MRFVPEYTLRLLDEEKYEQEMARVCEVLESIKVSGTFSAFDRTEIYYEYFLTENPRANIVIVHGLSEFTKKFYESAWYFLHQGYNVFVFDQRCHGLSGRLTDQVTLMHVDRFKDYAKDLHQFIEEVVLPAEKLPIYLHSHSMGGAVSALYMAEHPGVVEKAVLSAPMFDPVVKVVPYWLALTTVILGKIFRGPKKRFFFSRDFNPEVGYSPASGSSEARFRYNLRLRLENENYQSTPMTYGWTYYSLVIHRTMLKKRFIAKLQAPILLLSAENDATVQNYAHKEFAEKCKNCCYVEIPDENHSLLSGKNEHLEPIYRKIFAFLE